MSTPFLAGTAPAVSPLSRYMPLLPGLLLAVAVGVVSTYVGALDSFASRGFSALTVAIVLGMVIGNTVYPRMAARCDAGIGFSKQTLLRAGVVLYGLRLTLQDVAYVGAAGVVIDAVVLLSTFGLAWWLGTRVLGMERATVTLIGAGASICGAAAVMATAPVARARADQVAVAVATVVVFGTITIFLYPLLFTLNQQWGLLPDDAGLFGVYAGSTIHEVAQVIAAARAIGPEAADTAVIAKMVRVMMLAPFLVGLAALLSWQARRGGGAESVGERRGASVPWFAFGFIAVVLVNSLGVLPEAGVQALIVFDAFLLAVAMAALGMSTHLGAVRKAGIRPLALAGLLAVWLIVGGALINRVIGGLLG